MRRLALAVVLSAACTGTAAAALPVRVQVALKAPQVGKAYHVVVIPGGDTLSQPTLDLCGSSGYASERLRASRLQVGYAKRNDPLQLSNEVVTYRAGGAAQAVGEARRHALTCPLRTARFALVKDPRLLPGYLAVREVDTATVRGRRVTRTSYAVYQRLGTVLSAVYSVGPAGAAQVAFCLHAAEQAAQNLTAWYLGGPAA